jgi:hypothetical protein
MAAFDPAKFREMFPAFKDTTKYSDAMLNLWYGVATEFISDVDSPCRTLNGDSLQYALYLLVAHLLYLMGQQTGPSSGSGSGGGKQGGFVTSATVGEVSVSKLAPPAKDGWEWWLAGSPYGQQLWALLSLKAVGGFSVGGLPERQAFRKVGGVFF